MLWDPHLDESRTPPPLFHLHLPPKWTLESLDISSASLLTSSPPPPSSALALCQRFQPGSGGAGVKLHSGSGTLSWAGEDGAEPRQHRAALMKGQAAGRPSGYADRGLIGLMRCSVALARSGTTGRSRAERPTAGSDRERDFYHCLSFFFKLNICEAHHIKCSCSGNSGLKLYRRWLENKPLKPKIYHNKKSHLTVPVFWLFGLRIWTLEQNVLYLHHFLENQTRLPVEKLNRHL